MNKDHREVNREISAHLTQMRPKSGFSYVGRLFKKLKGPLGKLKVLLSPEKGEDPLDWIGRSSIMLGTLIGGGVGLVTGITDGYEDNGIQGALIQGLFYTIGGSLVGAIAGGVFIWLLGVGLLLFVLYWLFRAAEWIWQLGQSGG